MMALQLSPTFPRGFGQRFFSALAGNTRDAVARGAYRRTVAELEALDDRQLADLGIARGDIRAIAARCVEAR